MTEKISDSSSTTVNTTNYKSGFISLVGVTNVGKSMLFNKLTKIDLALVTKKPQTTQHSLDGVLTTDSFQAIFVDTPGYQSIKTRLGKFMLGQTLKSLYQADIVVFVTTPSYYKEEEILTKYLLNLDKPLLLVVNKIDLYDPAKVTQKILNLQKKIHFHAVVAISAKLNLNIGHLLDWIEKFLPINAASYDGQTLTNRNLRFLVGEFVREAAMEYCYQEIPYGVATQTFDYQESKRLTSIWVAIYVDKKAAQTMLIGKNGQMIKKIGIAARKRIEKLVAKKVFLQLQVKVLKNWPMDAEKLKSLGYS